MIKHYVELRKGTSIGKNCVIDSRVGSSGNCRIDNNVVITYDSILDSGLDVDDYTYISLRVIIK